MEEFYKCCDRILKRKGDAESYLGRIDSLRTNDIVHITYSITNLINRSNKMLTYLIVKPRQSVIQLKRSVNLNECSKLSLLLLLLYSKSFDIIGQCFDSQCILTLLRELVRFTIQLLLPSDLVEINVDIFDSKEIKIRTRRLAVSDILKRASSRIELLGLMTDDAIKGRWKSILVIYGATASPVKSIPFSLTGKKRKTVSNQLMSYLKNLTDRIPEMNKWKSLILEYINAIIKKEFNVKGCFYGSTVNGFATNDSDMDISVPLMHFHDRKLTENRQLQDFCCERLCQLIKEDIICEQEIALAEDLLVFITSTEAIKANVPIVKSKVVLRTGLSSRSMIEMDMDIGFCNFLGMYNSKIFEIYSKMHPKVSQLVCLVKQWAKNRGILGARDGFLSSYMWTIAVIYFLQKVQNLPNLQRNFSLVSDKESQKINYKRHLFMELFDDKYNIWFNNLTDKTSNPITPVALNAISAKKNTRIAVHISQVYEDEKFRHLSVNSINVVNNNIQTIPRQLKFEKIIPTIPDVGVNLNEEMYGVIYTSKNDHEEQYENLEFPKIRDRYHLALLLYDFFSFYAYEFDINRFVISIKGDLLPSKPNYFFGDSLKLVDMRRWFDSYTPYSYFQLAMRSVRLNSDKTKEDYSLASCLGTLTPGDDSSYRNLPMHESKGSKICQYACRYDGCGMTVEDPIHEGRVAQNKDDEIIIKEMQRALYIFDARLCECKFSCDCLILKLFECIT